MHANAGLAGALASLLLLSACGGGNGEPTFSKSFGGPLHDEARLAIRTSDGGYAFAGELAGRDDTHDDSVWIGELWLSKLDRNGDIEWQSIVTTPDSDIDDIHASRRAADGTYLVTGDTFNEGRRELTVTKYSAAGSALWERRYSSGAWTNFPFAGAAFGQGAFAKDSATDLWPLPDGGALVAGVSLANLIVRRSDNGTFEPPSGSGEVFIGAKSVIVFRVGADGTLLWRRRLTDGQFTSRSEDALIAKIRPTADSGAVLAYPIRDDDERQVRIVRLGPGGELLWQVDEDGKAVGDLEQTADTELGDGSSDGVVNDGFAVAIRNDPLFEVTAPRSRVVKLDSEGDVQWRRTLDTVDLASLAQVCASRGPGGGFDCGIVVAGTVCIDEPSFFSREPDTNRCDVRRAYVQRLTADGDPVLDDAATKVDGAYARVEDILGFGDGRYIAAIVEERTGPPRRRRSVFDATTLQTLVTTERLPGLDTAFPGPVYTLSAPDQVVQHERYSLARFSLPDPLSDVFVAEESFRIFDDGADLDGVVVGLVEVAPDSFIVVGGNGNADLHSGVDAWAVRVTAGQVDWQRELGLDGDPVTARTVAASGDGGVIIAVEAPYRADNDTYGASNVIKLTGAGEIAWSSLPLHGPETFIDIVELHRLASGGYLALGRSDPELLGREDPRFTALFQIDDTGLLTWQRRYALAAELPPDGDVQEPFTFALEAASVAPTADGGFVLASASHFSRDGLATVWRTNAEGEILWSRRFQLTGVSPWSEAMRIRTTPDGAYVLGLSERGAIAPEAVGTPHGERNVLLVKLDASGNPVWTRSYGAYLDETLRDLHVLEDGGLLVAGKSNSLGERSEAWILRLDAEGLLSEGCNAHLGSLPPSVLRMSSAPVQTLTIADNMVDPPPLMLSLEDTFATAQTPEVAVGRQCFGSTPPVESAPPEEQFTLTVTQPGSLTGVVVSTPAGLVCGTATNPPPCSANFDAGSDVFLDVDISGGLLTSDDFLRFEGCDEIIPDASGPESCRVRMTGDRTVRAIFGDPQDRFRLRVVINGVGTVRSGDEGGISCGQFFGANQDCEELYDAFLPGTTLPTAVTLSVFTHAENFQGWGGDCAEFGTSTGFNLVMNSDKTCTATFVAPPGSFSLSVQKTGLGTGSVVSAPAGIDCGNTCTADFGLNQVVRLLATEGLDSAFDGWTGCDRLMPPPSGSIAVCEVDMTAARNVEAAFSRDVGGDEYLLEFVVMGADGIVESSDQGIICTAAGPDCQEFYLPGVSVGISQTLLRSGGTFLGWGGDCAAFGSAASFNLLMNGDKRCTAQFSSPQFTLSVTKVGAPAIVRSVPAGIDCGATCSAPFVQNQVVRLEAIPNPGFTFSGWTGCDRNVTGANFWPDCEVDMTSNRTVEVRVE
jgi:hypothetical protein